MKEFRRLIIAFLIGGIVSASFVVFDEAAQSQTIVYGLGCIPEEINVTGNITANLPPPPSWDWREYGIMTSVKNQGQCGSCVAIACNGAFEAIIKWKSGETVDLSEAHLFFCSGGKCDEGMKISTALNYLRMYGTPDEGCFPYDGAARGSDLPCSLTCDDWRDRAYRIDGWGVVSGREGIKNALITYGPLVVSYAVYQDFDDYWFNPGKWSNKVYYHYYGYLRGYHAVVLVGYDDSGQYWNMQKQLGDKWWHRRLFQNKVR